MDDNTFKNDLFTEERNAAKGKRRSLVRRVSRQQILPYVKVPVEHLVVAVIIVLVLLVIVYAVGIETGQRRMPERVADAGAEVVILTEGVLSGEVFEDVPIAEAIPDHERSPAEEERAEVFADEDEVTEQESPLVCRYMVQLASFVKREVAEREAEKLRQAGYDVRIDKQGNWYQVSVPGFEDFRSAKEAQERFSDRYSDCFVRRSGS